MFGKTLKTPGYQLFRAVIHTALFIAVGGCSQRAPATGAAEFKVALLTPGSISDQAWNGGAYQGLLRIHDSLGARISHVQTRSPSDFDENFRQYGADGYSLVFGHGFEYQDAAMRVAPEFPKTIYITTTGRQSAANVAGLDFAFDEGAYLAGMLAGRMTRSNLIGCIGGTELPPVVAGFRAFAAGARSVNPRVQVVTSYIGNWDDVSAGKEQAIAQIRRGADVIFQNADAAGLGVFQAMRESKSGYVIGANSNQTAVAPDVTIASVVIDLPHAFLTVARQVQAHRFKPSAMKLGMESGVVRLEENPALASRVPGDVKSAIDSVALRFTASDTTLLHAASQ